MVSPLIPLKFICQLWVEDLSCFSHRWRTQILPGIILEAEFMLVTVIVLLKWKATANGVEAAEQKPTQPVCCRRASLDTVSLCFTHTGCCLSHNESRIKFFILKSLLFTLTNTTTLFDIWKSTKNKSNRKLVIKIYLMIFVTTIKVTISTKRILTQSNNTCKDVFISDDLLTIE